MKTLIILLSAFGTSPSMGLVQFCESQYPNDKIVPIFSDSNEDDAVTYVTDTIDQHLVDGLHELQGGMKVVVETEADLLDSVALTISEMYDCELFCIAS